MISSQASLPHDSFTRFPWAGQPGGKQTEPLAKCAAETPGFVITRLKQLIAEATIRAQGGDAKQKKLKSAPSGLAELEQFETRHRVDLRHLGADIQSNPFLFKSKIMSMRIKLLGMQSESEAVVGWAWGFATHQVFISNTPSTAFANEDYVVAFKIIGIKAGMPHTEYVGSYPCRYGTPCYNIWESQKGAAYERRGPALIDLAATRR